jgi:hypothetical protein
MNIVAKELLKQFIESVLDDDCGINKESHSLLMQMLVADKDIANVLHDSLELCGKNADGRYVINP